MHIARIFYEFIDTLTKILYYIQYYLFAEKCSVIDEKLVGLFKKL